MMIRPQPRLVMAGRAALVTRKAVVRLRASDACQVGRLMESTVPDSKTGLAVEIMPALLTTMSSRPHCRSAAETSPDAAPVSVRSPMTPAASKPAVRSSLTLASIRAVVALGRGLLFKIPNPSDGRPVVDMQTAALRHIERVDPSLPVMRALPSAEGELWAEVAGPDGRIYPVRLFTFLPGRVLAATALTPRAIWSFGEITARLGAAGLLGDLGAAGLAGEVTVTGGRRGLSRGTAAYGATGEPAARPFLDRIEARGMAAATRRFRGACGGLPYRRSDARGLLERRR